MHWIDAEAAKIARKAMKLKKPWWMTADNLPPNAIHCGAYGPFCGGCPEELPCVSADVMIDCQDCTSEMRIEWSGEDACPCWKKARGERLKLYRAWKKKHDRDNALTVIRHRNLMKPKRLRNQREYFESRNYTLGRKCAKCNVPITNRNKSGYCKQHVYLSRG